MPEDPPSARAKRLPHDEKGPFVEQTLAAKIARMQEILATWKRLRRKTDDFWPSTREELRNWDDPARGIFKFSDPWKTSPKKDDPLQKTLVDLMVQFDSLKDKLKNFKDSGDPELIKKANKDLKQLNTELMSQISRLQLVATEFRKEIKRKIPDSKYLRREWDLF
ncbi:hypothetical protein [Agrobacterium tumefaciens]|uniref:hypothetical protein n=1 Tax=Agrobacterium tumefaciens TaxID=358 RepID=UPI00287C5406|nr:hypothetical protein [Agrobacterium tumefaciens]MDS7595970.1 hypothetical protein [Agrobacterium tumefaciens]